MDNMGESKISNQQLLIGGGVLLLVVFLYMYYNKGSSHDSDSGKKNHNKRKNKENFTYDQILLNAKNYTFVPEKQCSGCLPQARPDFTSMTCSSSSSVPLNTQSRHEVKNQVDMSNKKPRELLEVKDLLPEPNVSGLNYGVDPGTDFANKTVWHRTTSARIKRRNWEGGAAMIRGDLIIDPGQQSVFQHTKDYRDLTPGFIPKTYCGEVDVEDLSYNMHKIH